MVWGLLLPSTFGQFWPRGDFEGFTGGSSRSIWGDRLNEYYNQLSPEEQKQLFIRKAEGETAPYGSFVLRKFTGEVGSVSYAISFPLTPIQEHEPPRFYETEKTYKSLGDLIKMTNGLIAVSGAFKLIIEQFEPSIHGFFPIEIRFRDGGIYPELYHMLVVGQFLDGLVPEKCVHFPGSSFREPRPGKFSHDTSKQGIQGLAMSMSRIGSAHLWRERPLAGGLVCFSDALVAAIKAAGLRLPKYFRMIEVA